jgi:hypothetical protein
VRRFRRLRIMSGQAEGAYTDKDVFTRVSGGSYATQTVPP